MYNFNKPKTSKSAVPMKKKPVKKKPGFMKQVAAKLSNLGGKVARSMPADQVARGKMGETY